MTTATNTAERAPPIPAPMIGERPLQALALLLGACLLAHLSWISQLFALYLGVTIALRVVWQHLSARAVPLIIRAPLVLLTIIIAYKTSGAPITREGGAALLIGLAVLKLVETRNLRDGRMLVAAIFFIAMTVFLFSQSLPITVFIGMVSIFAFTCLTLLRRYPESFATAAPLHVVLKNATLAIGRVALAAMPLAAAAFLFFPRLGEPLWGAPWQNTQGRTGISDEMRPGLLSKLWSDDTPVFRVSFEGAPPDPRLLYWRGPVLWNFDGETWSRARGLAAGPLLPMTYRATSVVRYEVLLEATEMNWYFPLDLPLRAAPGSSLLADGQMMTEKPIIAPKRLNLESATDFVFETTPAPGRRFSALRLPEGSNPRAQALARGWRAEGLTDVQIIDKALQMFNASFMYSLEPPPLEPSRSVDDFLFETRIGYCEHFASSFAFLMRAAGIPTRVVTGYQGGYWNRSGNYLVVRNSDAHAWTEVWQPGLGWVRTDPTSAVAPERILRGSNAEALPEAVRWYNQGWASPWLDRIDWVSRWWRQRIVDFDAQKQQQLMRPLGITEAQWQHLVVALAAVGGLALAFGVWWSMRGMQRRSRDPLLRAWRRFAQRLASVGVERGSDEGPLAYSRRAARQLPHLAGSILDLGREFARLRYDPAAADEDAARSALIGGLRRFRVRARARP